MTQDIHTHFPLLKCALALKVFAGLNVLFAEATYFMEYGQVTCEYASLKIDTWQPWPNVVDLVAAVNVRLASPSNRGAGSMLKSPSATWAAFCHDVEFTCAYLL